MNVRALLVQLVERRSPKPDVGGSSPPGRAELLLYLLDEESVQLSSAHSRTFG
jgi:hypothetical protein